MTTQKSITATLSMNGNFRRRYFQFFNYFHFWVCVSEVTLMLVQTMIYRNPIIIYKDAKMHFNELPSTNDFRNCLSDICY